MKTLKRRLLPALSILFVLAPAFAFSGSAEDAELVKQLVRRSPHLVGFRNKNIPRPEGVYAGTTELVFHDDGGKLNAKLQNTQGSLFPTDGPVTFLRVERNTVKFVNNAGATWELVFDPDGQLKSGGTGKTKWDHRYGEIPLELGPPKP